MEIVLAVLGSSVVASLATLLGTKALRKSEEQRNEAQAADLLSKTYSALIKSLNDEINRLKDINREMELHKDRLVAQINSLESEVNELRKQVAKLTRKLERYEQQDTPGPLEGR